MDYILLAIDYQNSLKTKKFFCRHCSAIFRQHWRLQRHMLSHSDQRPHCCNVCGKRFRQSAHLAVHQLIHNKNES